ncbi:hypothetical protein BD408DRAFT_435646 [Parasitella parasitica]|nr:hypothetical protein BD408DRAFT_435646 [Parasitella parasitica]
MVQEKIFTGLAALDEHIELQTKSKPLRLYKPDLSDDLDPSEWVSIHEYELIKFISKDSHHSNVITPQMLSTLKELRLSNPDLPPFCNCYEIEDLPDFPVEFSDEEVEELRARDKRDKAYHITMLYENKPEELDLCELKLSDNGDYIKFIKPHVGIECLGLYQPVNLTASSLEYFLQKLLGLTSIKLEISSSNDAELQTEKPTNWNSLITDFCKRLKDFEECKIVINCSDFEDYLSQVKNWVKVLNEVAGLNKKGVPSSTLLFTEGSKENEYFIIMEQNGSCVMFVIPNCVEDKSIQQVIESTKPFSPKGILISYPENSSFPDNSSFFEKFIDTVKGFRQKSATTSLSEFAKSCIKPLKLDDIRIFDEKFYKKLNSKSDKPKAKTGHQTTLNDVVSMINYGAKILHLSNLDFSCPSFNDREISEKESPVDIDQICFVNCVIDPLTFGEMLSAIAKTDNLVFVNCTFMAQSCNKLEFDFERTNVNNLLLFQPRVVYNDSTPVAPTNCHKYEYNVTKDGLLCRETSSEFLISIRFHDWKKFSFYMDEEVMHYEEDEEH